MMEQEDCSILLSVNDMNLVRRYGPQESWIQASEKDVGILNAGAIYMGLLADPYHSFN